MLRPGPHHTLPPSPASLSSHLAPTIPPPPHNLGSPPPPPLLSPPSDTSSETLNAYLSDLVGSALRSLEEAGCVELEGSAGAAGGGATGNGDDGTGSVSPTAVGRIASFYYLDHSTMATFARGLGPDLDVDDVLQV